jgi:zinc finger protein-like protein
MKNNKKLTRQKKTLQPLGHHMHSHCFEKWARGSYACPVCRRSVGDMRAYWRMLDALLERDRNASSVIAAAAGAEVASDTGGDNSNGSPGLLALPPALASRKQPILCNDCGAKGEASFHFVYHKCRGCGSYNTTLL